MQYTSNDVREAVADWVFKAYRTERVLIWTCGPFRKIETRRQLEDAYLKLAVVKKKGDARCRVMQSSDETHIDRHQRKASVTAVVKGTGVGKFQLRTGLSDPYAAYGKYETVVHMTVTAP